MARIIVRRSRSAAPAEGAPTAPAGKLDELLALIPTEVITVFTALLAVLPLLPAAARPWGPLGLFAIGVIATPVVLLRHGAAEGQAVLWQQHVVATLSFATWAMAIAWPFGRWWPPSDSAPFVAAAVLVVPVLGHLLFPKR